jgi:tyrosine-protein phosphatase SIW14
MHFARICSRPLLTLLVAVSVAASALPERVRQNAAQRERPVGHEVGEHLKANGVPNFGRVTPTLYRGGQPSAEGFKALAGMGIAIVVDTGRSRRDEALIKTLGMTYVSLPWYCPLPKDKVFDRFIEIIRENPRKKIFVHCRFGDDRTGMMIAAYRMGAEGWTAKEAMQEMHEFGYGPIHHLMCPGLAGYEKSFPRRLREDPAFENLR